MDFAAELGAVWQKVGWMELILDASLPDLRLALSENGELLWSVVELGGRAEQLEALLWNGLQASGCSVSHLKQIVVSRGPGSFTGLRVALAYAQGLAYASGRKGAEAMVLRAASTFEMVGLAAEQQGAVGSGVVLLPARRGWLYGAVLQLQKGTLPAVVEQQMVPFDGAVSFAKESGGWLWLPEGVELEELPCSAYRFGRQELLIDAAIGAVELFPIADPLRGVAPNYIEKPQAKTKAELAAERVQ